jgi:hypothetical protein
VKYYKNGHKGLITVEDNAPYFKQSTYTDDFVTRSNYDPNGEAKGMLYGRKRVYCKFLAFFK